MECAAGKARREMLRHVSQANLKLLIDLRSRSGAGGAVRPAKEVLCIPARKFKGNSNGADKSVRPHLGYRRLLAARFPEACFQPSC